MMDLNSEDTPRRVAIDPKWIAVLSYFWIAGWIVAFVLNNPRSQLASFHLRQALGLLIFSMAAGFIRQAPLIGHQLSAAAGLFTFILWITGVVAALNREERTVPVLGESFQEWFRNL